MKILLIDPFYNNGVVPPNYSLGEIEKYIVDTNVEIEVIDFVHKNKIENLDEFKKLENDFINKIVEKVKKETNAIIYITTSYGIPLKQKPVYPRVKKILKEIKENNSMIPVYVGGATVNYARKELGINLQDYEENVTDIIYGDEIKFVDILSEKYGIETKDTGIIKWNNWNWEKYPKHISLLSAKGCPSACNFCFENKIFDNKYIRNNIDLLIENIKYLVKEKGITNFAIEDSSFLFNIDFEYFCDKIIKDNININWTCYAKVFQINKYHNLLEKMKNSGCTSMIIGIETTNNEDLEKLQKGITNDEINKMIDYMKEVEIGIQGCFMVGMPNSSREHIIQSVKYAKQLDLFLYRWHIFQLPLIEIHNTVDKTVKPEDYFTMQLNVPDNCLDEVLSNINKPILLLNEEHFLIRGLRYIDEENVAFGNISNSIVTYKELFKILKDNINLDAIFDEEEMYNKIGKEK